MNQPEQSTMSIDSISKQLLQHEQFIEQLKQKIGEGSMLKLQSKIQKSSDINIEVSSTKSINKKDLDLLIEQITQLLDRLIRQKIQNEMNEIIEENNNILLQIKQNLMIQQQMSQLNPSNSVIKVQGGSANLNEISFSDVHKLIAEQKKKFQYNNENYNDAQLQKSISCLVDFKFESIEQKVLTIDKRLKTMEDKYETNLKSIWNVLSMTQGAVFEFLQKQKQKQKGLKQNTKTQSSSQFSKGNTKGQRKSAFFNLW